MARFDLDAFDSPEQVFEHLATLPPAERLGIELQLRFDALGEVCAPPTEPSLRQQQQTQQLRLKYGAMLQN